MLPVLCKECKHDEEAPNGICSKRTASDNLPVRCVGSWSRDKFYYLRKYIETFATATKNKWPHRNYIDLFSGPGMCFDRKKEEEIAGSPLIAWEIKNPFSDYYFVDIEQGNIEVLVKRTNNSNNVHTFSGDCNTEIDKLIKKINPYSINLAFIDPTGLDIRFDTIKKLSSICRGRTDLIINLPLGTAIKRNVHSFIEQEKSKLDEFFGTTEWRDLYQKIINKEITLDVTSMFIAVYNKQLEGLGYQHNEVGLERVIESHWGLPLYYLIFASRHPLGKTFWKSIGLTDSKGQRRLGF